MMDYYDLVLGLIPLSVVAVAGALFGIGIDLPLAVSTGSLVAAGLIGHAMFVRAPVGTPTDAGRPVTGPPRGSKTGEYGTAD